MISIPLLALVEALALGFRSSNRNSTAAWVLASSLVLMLGLIVVEFPAQFTPATYEVQQLREATFFLHLKLAAVALVISVLAIASLRSPSSWGRRLFWAGWSLNLTMLTVIVYMQATGRLFCC